MIKRLVKNGVHRTITGVGACMPLSLLLRVTGRNLLVLYYHVVSDEPLGHIRHLYRYKGVKDFCDSLECVLKLFSPISLDDILDYSRSGKPPPSRSVFLTFDDGLREMSEIVAPILKRKGLPAAFFISSGFWENKDLFYRFKVSLLIEQHLNSSSKILQNAVKDKFKTRGLLYTEFKESLKGIDYHHRDLLDEIAHLCDLNFSEYLARVKPYMDREQITGLINDGFAIGAHSIDHPPYTILSLDEQLRQTRESMRFLEEEFQLKHRIFAFPFSDMGVSHEYYKMMLEDNSVDLHFGTTGWFHKPQYQLIQRVSLEGEKKHPYSRLHETLVTSWANRY